MHFYCPLPSISPTPSRPHPDLVSVDCALTHSSDHSTPVLCPSKKKEHPIWSPICWKPLCLLTHVHKRTFDAKALTTPSRPICSLFVSPIFCFLSSFHLVPSRHLPACPSSDSGRFFCFCHSQLLSYVYIYFFIFFWSSVLHSSAGFFFSF